MDDQPTRPGKDLLLDAFRHSWSLVSVKGTTSNAIADETPSVKSFAQAHRIDSDSDVMEALVRIDIQHRQERGWNVVASDYPASFARLAETTCMSPAEGEPASKDTSPTTVLDAGQRVQDFEIVQLIGIGSYGRVYLARDVTLDRMVALKVTAAALEESIHRTSSHSEGRVLARLNHRHIVSVFREEESQGRRLLAMQYVAGHSLKDWNDRTRKLKSVGNRSRSVPQSVHGNAKTPDAKDDIFTEETFFGWAQTVDERTPVLGNSHDSVTGPDTGWTESHHHSPLQTMVDLVRKIADALQHAHGRGVLHHDIKPANILIDVSGNPLLTDFNVASVLGDSSRSAIGGTLAYMAPEHLRALSADTDGSIDDVDVRSDLYSLGVVLYELLTGRKHWRKQGNETSEGSDGLHQLLADRLRGAPAEEDHGIDSGLWAIIQKALDPHPDDRYQTANQFATDLTCWVNDQPNVHASRGSLRHRATIWVQRNRRSVAYAAAATVLMAALVALMVRSEFKQLAGCTELARSARAELINGNSPGAAERLGRAKQGLIQVRLSRLLAPTHYATVSREIASISRRIGHHELQRFTAQFGEVSLLQTHDEPNDHSADLVENALRSYGVLQTDAWQERSPFTDLSEREQILVEENVTQLLLHCVLDSESKILSPADDLIRVLKRLPKRHRALSIVSQISNASETLRPPAIESVRDGFDAYLYGVMESQAKRDQSALRWLNHSIELQSSDPFPRFWTHYLLGFTYQRLGNYDESLVQYGVCVGMRPRFAWPVFNMGLAGAEHGNLELARRCFRAAIRKDDDFGSAYNALGALEHSQGRFKEALSIFDQAIAKDATSNDLWFNRANTQLELGDRQAAIESLEICLQSGSHSDAEELLKSLKTRKLATEPATH